MARGLFLSGSGQHFATVDGIGGKCLTCRVYVCGVCVFALPPRKYIYRVH